MAVMIALFVGGMVGAAFGVLAVGLVVAPTRRYVPEDDVPYKIDAAIDGEAVAYVVRGVAERRAW